MVMDVIVLLHCYYLLVFEDSDLIVELAYIVFFKYLPKSSHHNIDCY